MIKKD
jgi:hypothetical protein